MKVGMVLKQEKDAERLLALAKNQGFQTIEIWPEGGLQKPEITRKLLPLLKDFDLTAHFPLNLYANTLLFSKSFMKRRMGLYYMTQDLDLLHELGVRLYSIHIGREFCPVDELAILRDECHNRGMEMNIENGVTGDWGKIERITQLAKALKVNLTFDIGHAFAAGQEILDLSGIKDLVTHVHLHDADQEKDHIGLGHGLLPVPKVVAALKDIGYDRSIILEVQHDPEYEKALVESKKLLEILWKEL